MEVRKGDVPDDGRDAANEAKGERDAKDKRHDHPCVQCVTTQHNREIQNSLPDVSQASPNFLTTTEDTSSGQKVGDTCPLYFPAPAPRKYRRCSALSATEL